MTNPLNAKLRAVQDARVMRSEHACWALMLVLLQLPACTKLNPAVCCTSPDDCASVGLPDGKTCDTASDVCVDHQCMPPQCTTDGDCSGATPYCVSGLCEPCDATRGCSAAAPVCELATYTCGECSGDASCSAYAATPYCDATSGACVACTQSAECPTAMPVCDHDACRTCTQGSDCASSICNPDGTCVAPSAVVYVDPSGADTGTCTQAAPCKGLQYALSQTSATRKDVVLATSTYLTNVTISSATTPAPSVAIHGNGSTLKPANTGAAILSGSGVPVVIADVVFTGATQAFAPAVLASDGWEIDDVTFHDTQSLALSGGQTIVRSVHITNPTGVGIIVGATSHLVVDRGVIAGGVNGISVQGGGSGNGTFDISNLLVYGTTGAGLYLDPGGSGTVAFSTIANCGNGAASSIICTTAASAVDTFTSSIVWNPDTTRATVSGAQCTFRTSIVGAVSFGGETNVDPMFYNSDPAHLYKILPASAAKDAVATGPAHDVDGDLRPQGPAYDLGAYEIP